VSRYREDAEDLSVRARRGTLAKSELEQLERVLLSNPTLRLAHLAAVDMDRATAVQTGDQQLIARAADAALARVTALANVRPRAQRVPRKAVVAAVTTACVGVIAAMWWLAHRGEPTTIRPQPPAARVDLHGAAEASSTASSVPTGPSAGARTAPATDTPQGLVPPTAADASRHTRHPRVRAAHARHEATAATTAAELFHRANLARGTGDTASAQRDYSELIARFPDSNEAQLAQISLGKLLLARGAAQDAEREFRGYLARGRGQLDEEALLSHAQTLRGMGRRDDEQTAWQTLLRNYPNSVYAERARRRLLELSAAATDRGP
jgi:TolA-binding protein